MTERIAAKVELIAAAEALTVGVPNCRDVEQFGNVAVRIALLRRLQIAVDAYHQLQEP